MTWQTFSKMKRGQNAVILKMKHRILSVKIADVIKYEKVVYDSYVICEPRKSV